MGGHKRRRAGSLVQKRGGGTSSTGSAFTTAVQFLGGTLRAGGRELLAVIPLTARARGGEFSKRVARRDHSTRVVRGSSLLHAPAPPSRLYFWTINQQTHNGNVLGYSLFTYPPAMPVHSFVWGPV